MANMTTKQKQFIKMLEEDYNMNLASLGFLLMLMERAEIEYHKDIVFEDQLFEYLTGAKLTEKSMKYVDWEMFREKYRKNWVVEDNTYFFEFKEGGTGNLK